MKKIFRHIIRRVDSFIPGLRKKKKRHPMLSDSMALHIRDIFDSEWYGIQYPHVIQANHDPFKHFIRHGLHEGLAPNAFFLSSWYLARHTDVADADILPLIHYLKFGAAEARDPHPDFDAAWYISQHPEAADSPLLFHMSVGRHKGWPTRPPFAIEDYLPSGGIFHPIPEGVKVDVVLPVYRGLKETQRCIETVLADKDRPDGRIIVIDDCSPEPGLSQWLDELAAKDAIHLLRNTVNLGFVRSVNRGMQAASPNDVVLLNSDTEVPSGWLRRLAGHAYTGEKIGSVTPFSNNATICSYPSEQGGPLPKGYDLKQLDDTFAQANAGRSVSIPTAVGFCMYIRRDCLDDVGLFDAETFGLGYGEENDFCMRAIAKGWDHRLACDTYVFHVGEVSFGRKSSLRAQAQNILQTLHPDYPKLVGRHVRIDPALPSRFAATGMLLRECGRPVILFVTHALGGGTERHVQEVISALKDRAACLIMRPNEWGYDIYFPCIPHHPPLRIAADRMEYLAKYLQYCGVKRVHIHHQIGYTSGLRPFIEQMNRPYDLTVHDYYAICPQFNLISPVTGTYCGEPEPVFCNACIGHSPIRGATDIVTWRLQHRWMFDGAERVLCPSRDVLQRLQRVGIHGNMIVARHQPVDDPVWPCARERLLPGQPLRVAILGTLAGHKGASIVRNTVIGAAGQSLEFHLIGSSLPPLDLPANAPYSETGFYNDKDLVGLIRKHAPHVIWFPALWPETYSYTLSTAIESGLPIVASNLGAFPERLANNPQAFLVSPSESAVPWIAAFNEVRDMLMDGGPSDMPATRPLAARFYPDSYLAPLTAQDNSTSPVSTHGSDKRKGDRPSVLLVPETMDNGAYSPCAYIRTILPFSRLAESGLIRLTIATPQSALHHRADILLCQRYVAQDMKETEKLLAHAKDNGMLVLYDIDDNLLDIPQDHPEYQQLHAKSDRIRTALQAADTVIVSTSALKNTLDPFHGRIFIARNSIDERLLPGPDKLWPPRKHRQNDQTCRILYMGTATHDVDMDVVLPALQQLHERFGTTVQIDLIGVTNRLHLPPNMKRIEVPKPANQTYPAFMTWLAHRKAWDIGISPLADTTFNRSKSSIKALDYMAIGALAVVSDVEAYRDLPNTAVLRVPNEANAWFEALEALARDRNDCRRRSQISSSLFLREHTLGVQMPQWLDVLSKAISR